MNERHWSLWLTKIGPGVDKDAQHIGSRIIEVKVLRGEDAFIKEWEIEKSLKGVLIWQDSALMDITLVNVARTVIPLAAGCYRFRTAEIVPLEYEKWLGDPRLTIMPSLDL